MSSSAGSKTHKRAGEHALQINITFYDLFIPEKAIMRATTVKFDRFAR